MINALHNLFIYNELNKFTNCPIRENKPLPIFYRLSSYFFTIWGLFVIIIHKTFRKYDNGFPWLAYGFLNFFHGFLIYINDVSNFGKKLYF